VPIDAAYQFISYVIVVMNVTLWWKLQCKRLITYHTVVINRRFLHDDPWSHRVGPIHYVAGCSKGL